MEYNFQFLLSGRVIAERKVIAKNKKQAWRAANVLADEISRRRPCQIKQIYQPLKIR